jgi:hypothetical protein
MFGRIWDQAALPRPLPYLSRYMGHATFESTYYYVHTSPDFLHAYMPKTRGLSPKSIEAYRAPSRQFLDYAAHEDLTLVALNQAAKALKAPAHPRTPIEYLTEPQTRAILAAFTGQTPKSRRNRMLLIPLYDTAARVDEITGLTLQDLALTEPGHLTLTGKGNKTRVVPLIEKTIDTCTSTSPSSTRTRRNSPRQGRCSTAFTTDDLPSWAPTRSRPCSSKPQHPHTSNAPRPRRTSTATCCARPKPWVSM